MNASNQGRSRFETTMRQLADVAVLAVPLVVAACANVETMGGAPVALLTAPPHASHADVQAVMFCLARAVVAVAKRQTGNEICSRCMI